MTDAGAVRVVEDVSFTGSAASDDAGAPGDDEDLFGIVAPL